jgi:predicted enzyme related to lactoylglutathione lyase
MFKVTKYPHGTFSWADCSSTDAAKTKQFYMDLMGWDAVDEPLGDGMVYTNFELKGEKVAGLGQMMPDQQAQGIPSYWTSYINVDDVRAVIANVAAAGGSVVVDALDIFEEGVMAVIMDPGGAMVGLWQPKKHSGSGLVNTPGAMTWNELMTRHLDQVKDFYSTLFGWTYEKMEGADYYLIYMNGGIMNMDEQFGDMPSVWTVYFSVANIDETAKKAKAMGGMVPMPVQDSGGTGRFAVVADPAGAYASFIELRQPQPWTA